MWPNPQFPANLVTFTEEIFNEKLYFLCSEFNYQTKLNRDVSKYYYPVFHE